jgi:type I restriction enzyme S subunit
MTDLPPGWEWTTLGDVGEWYGGGTPSKSRAEFWQNGSIPWLSPKDMGIDVIRDTQDHITQGAVEESSVRLVPSDSVAIVVRSGILERKLPTATTTIPTTLNQDMKAVKPDEGIDSSWVAHFLRASEQEILRNCRKDGTTVASIDSDKFLSTQIPIPPLAEQRRIVTELEDHLSRLDAATSSVERALARTKGFVGSSRRQILLERCSEWGKLGDLIASVQAGKSFAADGRPAGLHEWGIIKVSAMTWGEFRATENKTLFPGQQFDPNNEIRVGDILVSRANTVNYVGAPVLVRETRPRLLLSDKSLRLSLRPGVDPNWLIEVLSSPMVRQQISERATGTKDGMRNVSQATLLDINVPIVPPEEQAAVAEEISTSTSGANRLRSEALRARKAGAALRRSLLTEAFAGRLVPQDPDDEPAAVLLERIRAERAARPKPKRTRKTKPTQETSL